MKRIGTWIAANDRYAFHFINHKLKCKLFDFLLPKLTHLGGALCTISSLLLIILLSDSIIRMLAFKALLSLAVSHIIVHIIKKVYCRERPYVTLSAANLGAHPLKDYSFPSGHTTAVFSISIVFALHSLLLAIILVPLAMLIGFSRMYLGLHYPTDCMAGALLGTCSSLFFYFFVSF